MIEAAVNDAVHELIIEGACYRIRQLAWQDITRHADYQRLRADDFVRRRGWDLPLTADGLERDRHDPLVGPGDARGPTSRRGGDTRLRARRIVSVHTVYGVGESGTEHLLAGVRVFRITRWNETMLLSDFREVGMIPASLAKLLATTYAPQDVLELTRLCTQPGQWYIADDQRWNVATAVDLCYAAVYEQAERFDRAHAVALVDLAMLRLVRRAHFALSFSWARANTGPLDRARAQDGYAVVMVDLARTLNDIGRLGDRARAERFGALCTGRFAMTAPVLATVSRQHGHATTEASAGRTRAV